MREIQYRRERQSLWIGLGLLLAGALLAEPLELTTALTSDLPVPARAEIALEGVIDPTKTEPEGPYSEAGGYYGEGRPSWVIQVRAVTMRRDAIYHDLHPTHQEHFLTARIGRESMMYDAIRKVVPGLRGVHNAPEGLCGKFFTYVSIKKTSEEDVRKAGTAALGAFYAAKLVVVVDDDIDPWNEREVLWALSTRFREAIVIKQDTDSVLALGARGTKLVLDATKPLGKAFPVRVEFPAEAWKAVRLEDYLERAG